MLIPDNSPTVSVVIPCCNMGEFVGETVKSVLAQTYKFFEVIIVNDGSNDPLTINKLDQLTAQGMTVLHTPNRGVAAARNFGIKAARGKYILPLDADDLIDPFFLEKAVSILDEKNEIGIVGCDAELFGDISGIRRLPEFSVERLLSENLLFASAVFRKRDWQAVGGYCTSLKYGWEDWDFWIAMAKCGVQIVRIPEVLFKYRIRNSSRDRSMAFWQKLTMLLLIISRHCTCYIKYPTSLIRLVANAKLRNAGKNI